VDDAALKGLIYTRALSPADVVAARQRRRRPDSLLGPHGKLMIIAADHPARGALRAGEDALAMADRVELLDRLCISLANLGVNGILGTPDILDNLPLLDAIDDKVVIGLMNRGGLAGTSFEMDDRFTAFDAASIAASGYEGGKMLVRIDPMDAGSVVTLQACGRALSELADRALMAMVEPFVSHRVDGRVRNDLTPEAMTRVITVASGLGTSSAYTWLKVPVVDDMERVMASSTLPALILGGEVAEDPDAALKSWAAALSLPSVYGLVIGRSLLYPPDGDVAGAVKAAVELL
jgi:uncharacterized protein